MSNPQTRKSCVVPKCSNTTTNAPEKLFFIVPSEPTNRNKWMKVMKRNDPIGAKSTVYCCEDHFDIEEDMESYVKYKLVGGRIKLKKGVVPHKFDCKKKVHKRPKRSSVRKQDHPISSTSHMPDEIFVACNKNDVIEDKSKRSSEYYANSHKAVQVNHKAVQVALKNIVCHMETMTEEKYFRKRKNN